MQNDAKDTTKNTLYLAKKGGSTHIWVNNDTLCRMWSTNGIKKKSKYKVIESPIGHLCPMCQSVLHNPKETEKKKHHSTYKGYKTFDAEKEFNKRFKDF